jgi:hypothetical protein
MLTQAQRAKLTQKIQSALGDTHTIVRFPGCIGIRRGNDIVRRFKTESELRQWVINLEAHSKDEPRD